MFRKEVVRKNGRLVESITFDLGPWMILGAFFCIILKLVGVVDWSWLVVLAPIWVPYVFMFGLLAVFLGVGFLGFVAGLILAFFD